jgi:hypothetical protein
MKKMKENILKLLLFTLSFCFLLFNVSAQDEEEVEEINYKPVVKLSYLKNTEGQKNTNCQNFCQGRWEMENN